MKILRLLGAFSLMMMLAIGCSEGTSGGGGESGAGQPDGAGQSAVADDESQMDVVKVAVNSPDHTTLVAAVQAAELVDVLSNVGPFTVFAPTNDAFGKVPEETLNSLLEPENQEALQNILYHHVQVSTYSLDRLRNTETMIMFDGNAEEVKVEGDDIYIGGAKILATVEASNGLVHVVDSVILPD